MRHHRPDLIVPIRDRRQHRRILTLKNFAWAMGVLVAAFIGLTIEANLRRSSSSSGFGALYGRQLPSDTAAEPKSPEIVTEAPIPDVTAADPMLVAPAAREQLLRADSNVPATTSAAVSPEPVTGTTFTGTVAGQARVAVVGGAEGVAIVKESQRPPLLRGGFGREQ